MLQRYKIFLNGCNITTFFNTIHSFFCRKITKNTLKTTFYLNVTKTKIVGHLQFSRTVLRIAELQQTVVIVLQAGYLTTTNLTRLSVDVRNGFHLVIHNLCGSEYYLHVVLFCWACFSVIAMLLGKDTKNPPYHCDTEDSFVFYSENYLLPYNPFIQGDAEFLHIQEFSFQNTEDKFKRNCHLKN